MDTDYWHSLDRQSTKSLGLSTDYISVSTHPFKEQLDELKAKIFSGVKSAELSFIATKSGSRSQGQSVPEHYTRDEREELRQLAKVNDIELTTHSPANASSLSGFSERGFSPEVKKDNLNELKKSIEFAADVARGGPVTVHVWEYARPIFEAGETAGMPFKAYPKEEEKAPLYFVDKRTGRVEALDRNQEIPVPKGGFENPKRDEKTGFIQWDHKKIFEFEKEAREKKEDAVKYIFDKVYKKDLEFKDIEAKEYFSQAKKIEKEHEFLKSVIKGLEEQAKTDPSAARYNTITWMEKFESERREKLTPREGTPGYREFLEKPLKYLKELEDRTKKSMDSTFQAADNRKLEIEETKRKVENIGSLKDYALKETADSLSDGAIYAYKQEKEKKLEKPLIVSAENVFPEYYGAQPKELKEIILKSREEFKKKLVENKLARNEEEADKISKERIKATFDIGHANIWRKYYSGSDADFRKWILKEAEELQKQGIIGHVHINDNFGYEDVHVSPGQGNAPIKEFVDKITEHGFKGKMVIEAGNQRQGEQGQVLTNAWKTLNSPIYRVDSMSHSWTEIEGSYFGRTGSPGYIVGDFAPSKDWTLWSEMPLE